jgi:hypothetical protein
MMRATRSVITISFARTAVAIMPAIFNLYPYARAMLGGDALSYPSEWIGSSADRKRPQSLGGARRRGRRDPHFFAVMVLGSEFCVAVGSLGALHRR